MPTSTLTAPLKQSAAEIRAQEIAFAQEKLHFYEDGVAKWRPILQALKSGTTTTRTRAGNGARPTARRTRRTTKTVTADAITTFMRPGAPYQSGQMAKSLGATQNTVLRRLKELEKVGMVTRTGSGAQLRWMLA